MKMIKEEDWKNKEMEKANTCKAKINTSQENIFSNELKKYNLIKTATDRFKQENCSKINDE